MTNNPTSAQVLTVINKLTSILPKNIFQRRTLNMENGNNLCGTSMCHGGWYFVASIPRMSKKDKRHYSYKDGIDIMMKDLGFHNISKFYDWAGNFRIWGNYDGENMFGGSGVAFKHPIKRPKGAKTIQHIIDHWREVYERIKEIEEKEKKVKYVDATEEILALPISEGGTVDIKVKQLVKQ